MATSRACSEWAAAFSSCPHCGAWQVLLWENMTRFEGRPHFTCLGTGCGAQTETDKLSDACPFCVRCGPVVARSIETSAVVSTTKLDGAQTTTFQPGKLTVDA